MRNPGASLFSSGETILGNGLDAGFISSSARISFGAIRVAPLGNYGGSSFTMPPAPSSPAFDGATATFMGPITVVVDQRGSSRNLDGDGDGIVVRDIGAVEGGAPIVVTTQADENNGSANGISLREAISAVSEQNYGITFASGLDGETILLGAQLDVRSSCVIDAMSLPSGVAVSGQGTSRVIETDKEAGVLLVNLTVENGVTTTQGAGILSAGPLGIQNCLIQNCVATGNLIRGGGVRTLDECLTIIDSTIRNNSAALGAGVAALDEIYLSRSEFLGNRSSSLGGAIYAGLRLYCEESEFVGNEATLSGGGLHLNSSRGQVYNSTIESNVSGNGGAIQVENFSVLEVMQSTMFDNQAGFGSTINCGTSSDVTVSQSTIVGRGGAVQLDSGSLSLHNTVVSVDSGAALRNVSGGMVSTSGVNLLSNLQDSGLTVGPTVIEGEPSLSLLGDFGGETRTMVVLPGSLTTNPSNSDSESDFYRDQRGLLRNSSNIDIGAVEYQNQQDLRRFWELDFEGDGLAFGLEYALGTDPNVFDANSERVPMVTTSSAGNPELTMGFGESIVFNSAWVIHRSVDLEHFTEIVRYVPSLPLSDTNPLVEVGYDFEILPDSLTLEELTNPGAPKAFYTLSLEHPE